MGSGNHDIISGPHLLSYYSIITTWSANTEPEAIGHTCRASAATSAGPPTPPYSQAFMPAQTTCRAPATTLNQTICKTVSASPDIALPPSPSHSSPIPSWKLPRRRPHQKTLVHLKYREKERDGAVSAPVLVGGGLHSRSGEFGLQAVLHFLLGRQRRSEPRSRSRVPRHTARLKRTDQSRVRLWHRSFVSVCGASKPLQRPFMLLLRRSILSFSAFCLSKELNFTSTSVAA